MRNFVLVIHIISSLLVFSLTFHLVLRSFIALHNGLPIKKADIRYPKLIVILLYIQMGLGMLLFYFVMTDFDMHSKQIASHGRYWMRFWAVEHFTLMLFTVIIAHIGYFYNKNIKIPETIYKKNRLYFGITFVLISVSMIMNTIRQL